MRRYKLFDATRGYGVDPAYRLDAELWSGGLTYGIEFDNDTEDDSKLRKRLATLRICPFPVLFVAETATRIMRIMGLAKGMGNVFFAPLSTVLNDPYGMIFADTRGNGAAVEKPVQNSVVNR